jgi:peptidyl-prolyl cis-trans isomerase D
VLQQMRSAAKWVWIVLVVCFVGVFLFADTSGLLGLGPTRITSSTAVAKVNGVEVPYLQWANLSNNLAQQQERGGGRGLSLDDRRQVEDQAFEQLVGSILLEQEYKRRGIRVSDQEVVEAAQQSPPPELMQNPELQTDGRFDIDKYRRLLRSPGARQQGLLLQLENYYRTEIPRAKLFDQLAGDVYVPESKLWSVYRDLNDSAKVSFVMFDAGAVPDTAVRIPESDLRAYYDRHKEDLKRPGRAVVSVLVIPRAITAADTAAAKARAAALRSEIVGGAKFEDVARRESADSSSGANGGDLGPSLPSRYVQPFGDAAKALKVGEISQPVETPFGVHLIRLDSRKGDTLSLHHILVHVQQSDSSATRTDRLADSLARIAGTADRPERFDSAATMLHLTPQRLTAVEGEPLMSQNGRPIPSVSAWAFGGVKVGESSDLYDSDELYALARLDSLVEGGIPSFADAREDIRRQMLGERKAETLVPRARELAQAAAKSSLEDAAKSHDMTVTHTDLFTRPQFVGGLGRFNAAIGAAFSLPVGRISAPIVTEQGAYVMRVDRRVPADSAVWAKQKSTQQQEAINSIRQLRVRTFLSELRKTAKVDDYRKQLNAAARAQTTP